MIAILTHWFDRFEGFLSGSQYCDHERYLADAANVTDLEQRMRALEGPNGRRLG